MWASMIFMVSLFPQEDNVTPFFLKSKLEFAALSRCSGK